MVPLRCLVVAPDPDHDHAPENERENRKANDVKHRIPSSERRGHRNNDPGEYAREDGEGHGKAARSPRGHVSSMAPHVLCGLPYDCVGGDRPGDPNECP